MRLIDADELKTAFPCGDTVRTECVRATIDSAPTTHCESCPYKERRESEKTNEQFESCDDCIYSDVEESVCVQMQCIHAFTLRGGLRDRYVPKESVRKTGAWQQRYITTPTGGQHCVWECDGCGARVAERTKYCAEWGRRMTG